MSVLRRFDGAQWVQIAGPSNTARYLQGPIGDRPSADGSLMGSFYWATDEGMIYYCTGSAWEEVKGVGGEAFHVGDEPPEDPEIEMWYDTSGITNLGMYGIESGETPPEDTTFLWIDTEDDTGVYLTQDDIPDGDEDDLVALDDSGGLKAVDSDSFGSVVNTDGDPGTTIYVGTVDPETLAVTLEDGDVWIEVPE